MADDAGFAERWRKAWTRLDPEACGELYEPSATVLLPSMAEPLQGLDVAPYVATMRELVPDVTCQMRRWATKQGFFYVEWTMNGNLAGRPLSWDGAERLTLTHNRIVNARVYFDTAPFWQRVDRSLPRDNPLVGVAATQPQADDSRPGGAPEAKGIWPDTAEFVLRYEQTWTHPTPVLFEQLYDRDWSGQTPTSGGILRRGDLPGYYARILSALPDLRLRVSDWATNNDCLFMAWVVQATFADQPVQWEGIHRDVFRGDRCVDGVSFFDTLPLWGHIDPAMARGFFFLDESVRSLVSPTTDSSAPCDDV